MAFYIDECLHFLFLYSRLQNVADKLGAFALDVVVSNSSRLF